MGTNDTSWTRALMASSGIAIGHDQAVRHASPEWHEAADVDTPLNRLQKLATCKESEVRTVVARRADCPMGILASLAFDHDSDVRAGVAGNPRITDAVSSHLARDRDAKVVKALARNHAIGLALLERLALHKKDDVRRVASRNLDERIQGSAERGDTEVEQLLEPTAGGHRLQMPFELRDRVAAQTEWLPTPSDTVSPQRDDVHIAARQQLLPRLHPN
jgi:hypothetical protein